MEKHGGKRRTRKLHKNRTIEKILIKNKNTANRRKAPNRSAGETKVKYVKTRKHYGLKRCKETKKRKSAEPNMEWAGRRIEGRGYNMNAGTSGVRKEKGRNQRKSVVEQNKMGGTCLKPIHKYWTKKKPEKKSLEDKQFETGVLEKQRAKNFTN